MNMRAWPGAANYKLHVIGLELQVASCMCMRALGLCRLQVVYVCERLAGSRRLQAVYECERLAWSCRLQAI